jgi:hypothetical protein
MEAQMARTLIKVGGWYIAYEVSTAAVILGLAAYGVSLPGL